MRRRRHDMLGNSVRFLFVDIPRLVYCEFGLQTESLLFNDRWSDCELGLAHPRSQQSLYFAIPHRSLQERNSRNG